VAITISKETTGITEPLRPQRLRRLPHRLEPALRPGRQCGDQRGRLFWKRWDRLKFARRIARDTFQISAVRWLAAKAVFCQSRQVPHAPKDSTPTPIRQGNREERPKHFGPCCIRR